MTSKLFGFLRPKRADKSASTDATAANAANALRDGNFEEAIQLYDEVIAVRSDHAETYYKRANALNGLARWEAALADYDRAIALDPGYAHAHCNRGAVLEQLERCTEALASYNQSISLNSSDFVSYYNRGSALRKLGRLIEALSSYEQAIALKGDHVEAFINRGNVLQELHRDIAAVASYDKAIDHSPIHAEAFEGRGHCLLKLKRFESAIASYDRAIALDQNCKFAFGMRLHAKMQIGDWAGLSPELERLEAGLRTGKAVCPPFPFLALADSAPLQLLTAQIWVRENCPPNGSLGEIGHRPHTSKIRVGYFSSDFRTHPVSLLTAGMFEAHDRSQFEITAFAFGPDVQDAMRTRLERAFDRFVDVRGMSDVDVTLLSRNLGIDIGVDLGGFTEHSRTTIFALRAAPIQMSYIGYLGSMGAPYMDYLIADAMIVPPNEQQHYSEKIVALPSYQVNDSLRRIADRTFSREELGLPPAGLVYCCFNSNYKITPETFAGWMRILSRVKDSVLFLYVENETGRRNLLKNALGHGVDAARIVFGERLDLPDYLARFRTMDLFLDTFPYNAGTTASDALWVGLPVLTRVGSSFASRVAASLLRAIELPELITFTPAEYEELAIRLADDPSRLANIRQKLQANRSVSPLFDTQAFTRNLESAYGQVHERWRSGLPPDHIRFTC